MTDPSAVETPRGWTAGPVDADTAVYRNRDRGLEVAVRAAPADDGDDYRVELRQD